jgi:hypothetical protein
MEAPSVKDRVLDVAFSDSRCAASGFLLATSGWSINDKLAFVLQWLSVARSAKQQGFARDLPVVSLRIPWSPDKSQCLCGFYCGKLLYRKKFPDQFPAQGIRTSAKKGYQLSVHSRDFSLLTEN